jgi:hypothetical protein
MTSSVAFAATGTWEFDLYGYNETQNTSNIIKGTDGDQHAYITILNNCAGANFMPNYDILGVRVRKASNSAAMTGYHTYTTLVTAASMSYTTYAAGSIYYFMRGKIDSTSYFTDLHTNGRWTP